MTVDVQELKDLNALLHDLDPFSCGGYLAITLSRSMMLCSTTPETRVGLLHGPIMEGKLHSCLQHYMLEQRGKSLSMLAMGGLLVYLPVLVWY